MRLFVFTFFLVFLSEITFAAVNFGDGSDNCEFTNNTTLNKAEYQCLDLLIAAGVTVDVDPAVNQAVTLRVLGKVEIEGVLSVSADYETPGPGGLAGAECTGPPCDSIDANGIGGGKGGGQGDDGISFNGAGGGGGAGGRYGPGVAPGPGVAGASGGAGAVGGSAGAVGAIFGNESDFLNSISGGAGGGAGGSGDMGGAFSLGGNGGAGGGAIRILAKGSVKVFASGQILANGGDGRAGVGGPQGGGGCGGAGAGAGDGGNGGSGGSGRIRLDSPAQSYTGNPNFGGVTPAQFEFTLSAESDKKVFESDISYNCAFKSDESWADYFPSLFLGMLLITVALQWRRRSTDGN